MAKIASFAEDLAEKGFTLLHNDSGVIVAYREPFYDVWILSMLLIRTIHREEAELCFQNCFYK